MGNLDQELWIYNNTDSVVLFPIDSKLTQDLKRAGNLETCEAQTMLIEPLTYMTIRGMRVASGGIEKVSEEFQVALELLQGEIAEASEGHIDSPLSPLQCRKYFYGHLGIPAYKKPKTGAVTVDKSALARLARPTRQRPGYPLASNIIKYREKRKLKGSYYDIKLDEDGRLRGQFNPVGGAMKESEEGTKKEKRAVPTGRVSSSKTPWGTGTNVQTLPPEMRKYVLADEGFALYQADLSQAENRIVAYIAPEPRMIEAFESGTSIHRQTAGLIFGKPPEEISEKKGSCELSGGRLSEYDWGKRADHMFNYDATKYQVAVSYEISETEAQEILDAYFRSYPGIREYHRWVTKRLGENRTLTNLYGRKRKFLNRWDNHLLKEAYSFIPQSTVADRLHRDCIVPIYYNQEEFGEVDLLLDLHDALYFQIGLEHGWDAHVRILKSIKALLEKPLTWMGRTFVIPAEFKTGRSFGEMTELSEITQSALCEVWND